MRCATAMLLAVFAGLPVSAVAARVDSAGPGTFTPEVHAAVTPARATQVVSVIVRLRDQADLSLVRGADRGARLSGVIRALQAKSSASQSGLRALLEARRAEGLVSRITPFWIFNGLGVTAAPEVIEELAARPDVAAVTPDEISIVLSSAAAPEANVAAVRAPDLWALGFGGQGAVVATMDSGADATHPDLAPRWRGGANSWFDPYGQHATPADLNGHGTWTLGVLVGGDAGGTSIGVAPQAQWIAARIFDDAGGATATAIHQAFQWLLDPDHDPGTADAPDVVNGSWSFAAPGCYLEFRSDVQALRAAGILAVFAAGNFGPAAATSVSPANYPESLAVGATDDVGQILSESGRGPSACDGRIYPDVVAPGAAIRTSDLSYGGAASYVEVSGTSLAAPHVAGEIALLLSAFPNATALQLDSALRHSARDLGPAGLDDTFGAGLVDALVARDLLDGSASAPSTFDDAYRVAEDSSNTFTAPGVLGNDVDPGGNPLTAILVTSTRSGTLSLRQDGGFSYTPAPNFSGTDVFTYKASIGALDGNTATVTITVDPVNDPPVAMDDSATTSRGVVVRIAVTSNDRDVDGTVVPGTVVIVAAPKNGTVTSNGDGTVTYAPAKRAKSSDSFTYTVNDDGGARSNVATVRVQVR